MKNKHLKSEVANLLEIVDKTFGKDSVQYQNLDYYFDILVTVYEYNYDSEKDLLSELKQLLNKLSEKIPELEPQQFKEKYPNINQMIDYLDKWLTD
jgi:cell division septum initiation protein DivIVA